jgi:hypothetical protein
MQRLDWLGGGWFDIISLLLLATDRNLEIPFSSGPFAFSIDRQIDRGRRNDIIHRVTLFGSKVKWRYPFQFLILELLFQQYLDDHEEEAHPIIIFIIIILLLILKSKSSDFLLKATSKCRWWYYN